MAETLTRGEAQVVLTDLNKELESISESIRNQGWESAAYSELYKRQSQIQKKISELLKKGGVLTEDDYNSAYELIKSKKEGEIKSLFNKGNSNLLIGAGIIVALIAFAYYKKK